MIHTKELSNTHVVVLSEFGNFDLLFFFYQVHCRQFNRFISVCSMVMLFLLHEYVD